MAKPKQFVRPQKKQKPKANPETADEFQEAADKEEEAGGKHRVGDPNKSARAFVRALDVYDKALEIYPSNFDLAYNKARLQFEITQQPILVEHIGLPQIDLLKQTLDSHRYALQLNEENQDALFNTSQVLTSLAEQLSEHGQSFQAIPLLQEALELLSACLSRQEMLFEQQKMQLEEVEEGGVQLDPDEKRASTSGSEVSEQTALIESPITANDLLDTVHASLSALTTLVPLVEESALQTYGDLAQALTEKRAPTYFALLPTDSQTHATFSIAVDRAVFIAAFADAQYNFHMLELATYLERLNTFDIPGKDESAQALCSEAEARSELAHSAMDRLEGSSDGSADLCWKQLSVAQDLYTKASKLETDDAKERKADIYESKGSLELLRHRLVTIPNVALSESIKRSAQTLIQNAQTYYKGAAQLARNNADHELEEKAKQRWLIAAEIGAKLYGVEPSQNPAFDGNSSNAHAELLKAVEECIEEGLVSGAIGQLLGLSI